MKVRTFPNQIKGEITVPPSKSYAHRILLCATFSRDKVKVGNLILNEDISATMDVLRALGAEFEKVGEGEYIVTPVDRKKVDGKEVSVFARESGSTLRFLLPVLSALGAKATVDGKEGLRKRPIKLLLDVLRAHGIEVGGDSLPVKLSGKLEAGEYVVDASQSSQNVTGLLCALSLLDGKSQIKLEGERVSVGYIDITLDVLQSFGADIKKTEYGYDVVGAKKLEREYVCVEGDYSSSAFLFALGALSGEVKVKGLNPNSLQGDRAIISVLQNMGAKIEILSDGVKIEKSDLKGLSIDATDIPDLIPIIAVCCACASGESEIKGVDRLKIKESDRLKAVQDIMDAFGVGHEYSENVLKIYGGGAKTLPMGEISGYNDHRIVMIAVVMAIANGMNCTVTDAQAIEKSYPAFFEDLEKLGGKGIVELL